MLEVRVIIEADRVTPHGLDNREFRYHVRGTGYNEFDCKSDAIKVAKRATKAAGYTPIAWWAERID